MWTDEELEKKQGSRVATRFNSDFLFVTTISGRGRMRADTKGAEYFFSPDVSNHALGEGVLDALSKSRFISLEEYKTFFNPELCKQQYLEWEQMLRERFGYKTKRALYKGMKNVIIQKANDVLRFSPSYQERSLDYWSGKGLGPEDDVQLPATSSAEEIGAALRLAFSRCKGP